MNRQPEMRTRPTALAVTCFAVVCGGCSKTSGVPTPAATSPIDAGLSPDASVAGDAGATVDATSTLDVDAGVADTGQTDAAACNAPSPADGGSCRYPKNVQVCSDPAGSGCFAHAPGQICLVSNGATILPDGGVSGSTESCKSICGASQYEMTCMDTDAAPDPSLGCQLIPIPTPSCCLYYCCPCVE